MYFELTLPLAVAGLIDASASPRFRWRAVCAWSLAVLILLESVVLTFSRGALLGLAASGVVAAILVRRNHRQMMPAPRQRRILLATLVLAAVATLITLLSTPL